MKKPNTKNPKELSAKEKNEAIFKGLKRLLKKHGIDDELEGLFFKSRALPERVVRTAEDECPPCPEGYECVTKVDPITFEKRRVCVERKNA